MAADELVALVYRTGCAACGRACCPHAKGRGRQYAFHSIEDLEKWAARKPYRDEILTVIVCKDGRSAPNGRRALPAAEAADFAVMIRAAS